MFSDEYIEFCRRLALPREWQEGDWYVREWEGGSPVRLAHRIDVTVKGLDGEWHEEDYSVHDGDECIWLPREGDLLDLLEAEHINLVVVDRVWPRGVWMARCEDTGVYREQDWVEAPDRLTALCRLYMAVKGIAP